MSLTLPRLYWRLLLWFCLANVVTLLVSVSVTQHLARQLYQHKTDWQSIAERTLTVVGTKDPRALRRWRNHLRRRHILISLLDADGTPLLKLPHVLKRHLQTLQSSPEVTLHPRSDLTLVGLDMPRASGRNWRFLAARFVHPRRLHPPWLPFLIEILVSLLVIGVVGWRVARGISRPVSAVQRAARRMARGQLEARVGQPFTETRDELGQLAHDFDHMATRVQSLVERQRSVLQDVSHELRSPLARLNVALELARSDAGETPLPSLDRAEREIARLDSLIGEVLELARMEDRLPGMIRQDVDLAALARERLNETRLDAEARDLHLQLETSARVSLQGSRVLLGRAIDNLLSNAIKYSPEGGTIKLRIGTDRDQAVIEISDAGPGVPDDEIDALFRPFFRGSNADRAEGHGLGLGLAIIARIIATHGGRCEAHNQTGGGLRVTLTLPFNLPADANA